MSKYDEAQCPHKITPTGTDKKREFKRISKGQKARMERRYLQHRQGMVHLVTEKEVKE